jgi:hypothetical protein
MDYKTIALGIANGKYDPATIEVVVFVLSTLLGASPAVVDEVKVYLESLS